MKKTLIAVAALAATGAFAQVTVYGRVDAGYSNTTSTDYLGAETKLNGVTSHNSVSSLWGIKASEDLGGGLKANVKLEMDVYPANGNLGVSGSGGGATTSAAFDRTSTVGLSGAFGSIDFGRDYTPLFSLLAGNDLMATTRLSTMQLSTAGGGSTLPNQIIYRSPSMSGFAVNVSYNNQDTSAATVAKETGNTITAAYSNGPLMVGFGAGNQETDAAGVVTKTEGSGLVASYNFGVAKVGGSMITTKKTGAGVVTYEAKENNLWASFPMGKATLLAAVGNNDTSINTAGVVTGTGTDMVIGVDYALSAKTALFAKTGTVNKIGDNQKVTGTTLGIKTVF